MALSEVAEAYFKSMSPLAAKMYGDIEDAQFAYEHLWQTLTDKEKVEIINETIIKPEITLKYSLDSLDYDIDTLSTNVSLMSYFKTDPGQRIVTDDNTQWRDEHSGPFLHHTRSQLDLCLETEEVPPMSELALSHSKVVLELKNALKSHDVLKNASRLREEEPVGFLSKLIGGKCRSKEEDRQWLVSGTSGTTGEIVPTNSYNVDKHYRSSVVQSDSGLSEERRGLLCSISQASSSTQEFVSCEELSASGLSSDTLTMRSGFDFLDNW